MLGGRPRLLVDDRQTRLLCMSDNPFSPPIDPGKSTPTRKRLPKALKGIFRYLAAYLSGILACVLLTEAEVFLAGKNLLPWYVLFSPIGVALWCIAAFQSLPSVPFELGWALGMLLSPCVGEAIVHINDVQPIRRCRPLWISFPIGFVGTLGIYWAGSLSI